MSLLRHAVSKSRVNTIRRALRSCRAVSSPRLWPLAIQYSRIYEKPLTKPDLVYVKEFLRLLEETEGVEGDVVECGVWIGRSLALISGSLRRMRSRRVVHGFDSFKGFPSPTTMDRRDDGTLYEKVREGYFSDTTEEIVRARLRLVGMQDRVILHKGYFAETLPRYSSPKVSFAHLDCDLYESYRVCLEYLWPKVAPGGIMVFDEMNAVSFPGGCRAIDKFFSSRREKPIPLSGRRQVGWVRKAFPERDETHAQVLD